MKPITDGDSEDGTETILPFYFRYYYRARGSVFLKTLCYKPEGRGFDAR
jgi:hypothetical protein